MKAHSTIPRKGSIVRWIQRAPVLLVVFVLAGSALAGGVPAGPVIATEAASGDCERSAGDEEHAERLRKDVGLPNSPDLVAASFSLPGYSCELAGIPLSADEEAAFLDVINAQAELSELHATVSGDPTYAGAWLEAGTLNIASIGGRLGGDLQPENGSIELRPAQFTYKELEAVAAEIGQLSEDSAVGPLVAKISRLAVDVRANEVSVGVDADVQEAGPAFAKVYGELVSVYFAKPAVGGFLTCNTNYCGTKGGLPMDHDDPRVECTTGFLVKTKPHADTTYTRRILTAGHCVAGTGGASNTDDWHNATNTVTWGHNQAMDSIEYQPGEASPGCPVANSVCVYNDLGLVGVGSSWPANWNQYYVGGSPGYVEIDGSTAKANQLIGHIVFRTSRTTGLASGAITDILELGVSELFTDVDCYANDPIICRRYNLIEVAVVSDHGDSGAGFYRHQPGPYGSYLRVAYGILCCGHATSPYTYYYSWDQTFYAGKYRNDRRDVFPCISSSCPL